MSELNFPHVEVNVVDNSFETVVSDSAAYRLFSPILAEKGRDNKITYLSPGEYNSKFGNLNYKLYGQSGYNVVNCLENGGGAFVIRLTADNATYSHAILNIQTKLSKKKVKNYKDELVDVNNVSLRHTVIHLPELTNLAALETMMNKKYDKTIDGYDNNPLLAIIPEGRGKYYNRYSFRITPYDDYDATFDFRTYLFESLVTDEKGQTSVAEGPFLVSLEPGTVNLSNQSIFISNVINSNSKLFKVVFNENNYNSLTTLINNEVPKSVDLLFGLTRKVNDAKEEYFDSRTGKNEDIHMAIHQYDSKGNVFEYSKGVPLINITNTDSKIQQAILNVDDTTRELKHSEVSSSVETMLVALSRFRSGAYEELVKQIANFSETQELTGGSLFTINTKLKANIEALTAAKTAYTTTSNKENLLVLISKIDIFFASVKELKAELLKLLYTSQAIATTTNVLDLIVQLSLLEKEFGLYEIMKVNIASVEENIIDLQNSVELVKNIPISLTKLETLHTILFKADEVIRYVTATDVIDQTQADADIVLTMTKYNEAVAAYELAMDEYILPSELDNLVLDAIVKTEALTTQLFKTVDLLMVENSLHYADAIEGQVDRLVLESIQAASDSVAIVNAAVSTEQKEDLTTNIKSHINTQKSTVLDSELNKYSQILRKYSDPVSLINGSEGDLEFGVLSVANRQKLIDNLFIKAFKGLIDPDILDEEIIEFDFVSDANFSDNVKQAMISLVLDTRDDVAGVLDLGLTPTPEHALEKRKNTLDVDSSRVFIYSQDATIYDENSSSDIQVTVPYFVAGMLPNHDKLGIHQPFAGRRAVITGVKQYSWIPNKDYKEKLYKNQINYIDKTKTRTGLGTQLTSQRRNSALSNINNVLVLLQLKRKIKEVTAEHIIELVNEENLSRLNRDLNLLRNEESNRGAYKTIEISAYANDTDIAKKVYRVRIEVVFNDITEKIYSSIVVKL